MTEQVETAAERKRRLNREGVARHRARIEAMTRLEQVMHRVFGSESNAYLSDELAEAEAIRKLVSEAQGRAKMLNGRITKRLHDQKADERVIREFESMANSRFDLMPF